MATSQNFYFLSYDIPDRSNIQNPSPFLRRRAARIQLSVWVVSEANMPHARIQSWRERGANVYVVKFDAAEAENLIVMVHEGLKREAEIAKKRAEKAIESAEKAMSESKDGADSAFASFEFKCQKALKRVETIMGDLEHAAGLFGIDAESVPTVNCLSAVRALQQSAFRRAEHYVEMAKAAAQIGGEGQHIADLAQADEMNPLVLANYLEDNGVDASEARDAFTGDAA